MSRSPFLSVVVPIFNEEESVELLYERIRDACEPLDRTFEIVLVDDGSTDRTAEILQRLHRQDPRVVVLRFHRNSGQTAAMAAGFEYSRGEVVISLDGDLQNDPGDIPLMLDKIEQGFDVVCGWRKNRKDKFLSRRVPSIIANWIIGRVTGVRIHDNGCSLKAFRASTIKRVSLYGEMHRFIPAMSTLAGARIAEVVVRHHARQYGESKYGLSRVWRVCLDIVTIKMITGFVSRPARWFGFLSVPCWGLGIAALVVASLAILRGVTETWLVSSTVAFLLFFLATHLLSLGVVGELVVTTGDYRSHSSVVPLEDPSGE